MPGTKGITAVIPQPVQATSLSVLNHAKICLIKLFAGSSFRTIYLKTVKRLCAAASLKTCAFAYAKLMKKSIRTWGCQRSEMVFGDGRPPIFIRIVPKQAWCLDHLRNSTVNSESFRFAWIYVKRGSSY